MGQARLARARIFASILQECAFIEVLMSESVLACSDLIDCAFEQVAMDSLRATDSRMIRPSMDRVRLAGGRYLAFELIEPWFKDEMTARYHEALGVFPADPPQA